MFIYSITKETIILSSLFFGSVYMTGASLKEINKLSSKDHFISFTISWSIFGLSSVFLLTTTRDMYKIMANRSSISIPFESITSTYK